MSAYKEDKMWTDYMLSYEGFMHGVMLRLREKIGHLEYFKEIYTIDAMFVGGEDLFRKDLCYPSQLHVLIEHENGRNIEEEMWKLLFWRAPLKVLIFYDWNEDDKSTKGRNSWLTEKLNILLEMRDRGNKQFPENKSTEYLFIIGNRKNSESEVSWRWSSVDQIQLLPFVGG